MISSLPFLILCQYIKESNVKIPEYLISILTIFIDHPGEGKKGVKGRAGIIKSSHET